MYSMAAHALERYHTATPKIEAGDIVIVNTGWHKCYGDKQKYYGLDELSMVTSCQK